MSFGEFSDLPLLERIQKYRAMAGDARKQAEATSSQTARRSYVVIAEHWEALAADAERKLGARKAWLLE